VILARDHNAVVRPGRGHGGIAVVDGRRDCGTAWVYRLALCATDRLALGSGSSSRLPRARTSGDEHRGDGAGWERERPHRSRSRRCGEAGQRTWKCTLHVEARARTMHSRHRAGFHRRRRKGPRPAPTGGSGGGAIPKGRRGVFPSPDRRSSWMMMRWLLGVDHDWVVRAGPGYGPVPSVCERVDRYAWRDVDQVEGRRQVKSTRTGDVVVRHLDGARQGE
jgi:hypothetical protein